MSFMDTAIQTELPKEAPVMPSFNGIDLDKDPSAWRPQHHTVDDTIDDSLCASVYEEGDGEGKRKQSNDADASRDNHIIHIEDDAGVDVEDDGTREGKYIDPGDEGVKGQVMGEQKDRVSHEAALTSTCMIRSQGAKETTTGTKKGITHLTHTRQFCKGSSRKPGTKKHSLLQEWIR